MGSIPIRGTYLKHKDIHVKNKKNPIKKPAILLISIIVLFIIFRIFDITRFLNLTYMQSQLSIWNYQLQEQKLLFTLTFFIIYIVVTTLSIPGAALLTLLAGTLFGIVEGVIIVSFASTIGATLSFLISKYFLKDYVEQKFRKQFIKINEGIVKEGPFYLFALRLVPVFPFFVINLVMGLTRIPTLYYMFVSQIGMLPGTIVYVNAGQALSKIKSTSGILSPSILSAFALLAMLPFISKKTLHFARNKKVYKSFHKPKSFDANLIVIGAGSGGLTSAYIAATLKANVILIEKHKMGGDCLNTGCVPSKTLINLSKHAQLHKELHDTGVKYISPHITFSKVMNTVHKKIAEVAPHDSIERYQSLGVTCIEGEAKIISPWEVKVNDTIYTTKSIIIASGGSPIIPDIPGIVPSFTLTSDTVWNITSLPRSLVVVGGGPIGCELALAFAKLGSKVTLIHKHSHLLNKEDNYVGDTALEILQQSGVQVYLNYEIIKFTKKSGAQTMHITEKANKKAKPINITFSKVLFATGRKANLDNLCDDTISITLNEKNYIQTNAHLQTNIPNIFAVGDVVGHYQFTHIASHMAWYATVNALLGFIKMFKVNYSVVPAVTFLSPEIARVGITEKEAEDQNIDFEVTTYHMKESDRAIAEGKTSGYIKVITEKNKDKILGAVVIAERAGEMLAQFILAMKHNLGLKKILGTTIPYPTYAEASKATAGLWTQKHAPEKLLSFLKKFFGLMIEPKKK